MHAQVWLPTVVLRTCGQLSEGRMFWQVDKQGGEEEEKPIGQGHASSNQAGSSLIHSPPEAGSSSRSLVTYKSCMHVCVSHTCMYDLVGWHWHWHRPPRPRPRAPSASHTHAALPCPVFPESTACTASTGKERKGRRYDFGSIRGSPARWRSRLASSPFPLSLTRPESDTHTRRTARPCPSSAEARTKGSCRSRFPSSGRERQTR